MQTTSTRTLVTLVLAGALVLTAGCSGIGLGDGDVGASSTEEPAENVTDDQTDATATESESDSDDGHSHDGHDHSHGDGDDAGNGGGDDVETTAGDDADGESAPANATLAELSGKMTVAVDGSELDLPARDEADDAFAIAESDEHTWTANETDLTLAAALSRLDVNASGTEIGVDGERYTETTEGATISYRVDGEPVDPEEYVLEDADLVWITVTTAETNVSAPGPYIKAAQQHAHGEMSFVVEGEEVDFSKDMYQANHKHFHYEHGDGETWHAHSWSVSLAYALSTLEGIHAEDGVIEYNGTTYDPEDEDTTVDVTVNDEPVDADEYVLKDGDSVRITVDSEG